MCILNLACISRVRAKVEDQPPAAKKNLKRVPVRAELYRAMEPGTHGAACSGEPGSHHADQSQPSPSEGPQANQAPSKPTRGGGTPPRGPETHSDEKPNQGEATRARGKTKPDKAEKTRQPRQGRRAEASQGKTRTSDPAQAGQGKQAQGKPKQGKGLGDSRGQSQSALVCHSSIPSETSKTGRAAVVSARPKHNPEAPNTRQSVHVCKSVPVKTCKTGRTAVVSAGARVPAQPRALRIISALPVCRIVLNC